MRERVRDGSGFMQTIGFDWKRGGNDDGIAAAAWRVHPVRGVEVGVFLQHEAGRGWCPRNARLARTNRRDGEQRRISGLHCERQRPEAAHQRVSATGHGASGVGLADGARERVNAAGARAATAINGEPVDGVGLCRRRDGSGEKGQECCFHRVRARSFGRQFLMTSLMLLLPFRP